MDWSRGLSKRSGRRGRVMSEVKKYAPVETFDGIRMEEDPIAGWVKYEDYMQLETALIMITASQAHFEKRTDELKEQLKTKTDQLTALKAAIELCLVAFEEIEPTAAVQARAKHLRQAIKEME